MANMAGREAADLNALTALLKNATQFEFFQLLRLLEFYHEGSEQPFYQWLHLRTSTALVFPAAEIQHAELTAEHISLELNFMGLYGVDGVLPHYFSSGFDLQQEDKQALKIFLDIFNQRFYHLLYLAWKKSQVHLQLEQVGNSYIRYLVALSSNRLNEGNNKEFAYCSLLGGRFPTKALLSSLLRDYLATTVTIKEWAAREIIVERKIVLGKLDVQLGNNFLLGNKVIDYRSKILIAVGPMTLTEANELLPHTSEGRALGKLIQRYLGPTLEFVIMIHFRMEKKPLTLGISPIMLGYFSYLGQMDKQNAFKIQGKNYG